MIDVTSRRGRGGADAERELLTDPRAAFRHEQLLDSFVGNLISLMK